MAATLLRVNNLITEFDTDEGRVRAVLECDPASGVRRRDEILSRSRRTFGPRYTRDIMLRLQGLEDDHVPL